MITALLVLSFHWTDIPLQEAGQKACPTEVTQSVTQTVNEGGTR